MTERSRVLITVKAAPEPSKQYVDTVCVAGVVLGEDELRWVRIYPVAFRYLTGEQQFHKYQVIDAQLNPSPNDARGESRRPVWDSLRIEDSLPIVGRMRGAIVEQLIGPTMCDLNDGIARNYHEQSLGLVTVRELDDLRFESHPGWTPAQITAMTRATEQLELFEIANPPPMLKAPRFKVRYSYRCMRLSCGGHTQLILDWELAALQYHNRTATDPALKNLINEKFHAEMWSPALQTHFYVGNFADIVKRRHFAVLGVYRAPSTSQWGNTLF